MKRLILLRHGKSSWEFNVPDVERTLLKRAYDDADRVAEAFQKHTSYRFSLWTSKATRAKTTAELVAKKLNNRIDDFQIKDKFYTFDSIALLTLVQGLPNEVENMMLVGHNPAYTQLINYFCSDANLDNLSTTGLAEMEFLNDDWKSIQKAKLNLLLMPKNLH